MLDNSLDFNGVCATPITKERRELLPGSFFNFQDSEGSTASRMLFPPSAQESPRGLPDTNDLCLGLQSLSLPGWDRPWSTQDSDAATQPSTQSVLNMLSNPLGKPPLGFLPLDPIGSELTENLPNPSLRSSRLDSNRSLLYSRSSSPSDSDTSGFSSGSDHLSDLISSLRISPPLPFLPIGGLTRDSLNGAGSHLDQDQATIAAVTSTPTSIPKQWPGTSTWPSWNLPDSPEDLFSIEREAKLHKQAAAMNEATCTWSGQLPPRNYKNPVYSCKVFLGGVPWDITEAGLISTFRVFGSLRVEWPGKDSKHPRCPPKGNMPKGYAYLVFESEKSVRALLQNCSRDVLSPSGLSEYYFKMSSRRMRCKEVQVIPWVLADSNFVRSPTQRLDPGKTVFVGALHGMLNAEALAGILNDLFGGVVYAGIDTDKHKYPIGSGRVTFNNQRSYLKAVSAAFVEIKTTKFTKKVQIDPYLEDAMCQVCRSQPGPFFCRDQVCFKYFCRSCWHWKHSMEILHHHRPLMRNQKNRDAS
ncbi:cytoplasmic polyadenylation element-binding protein 1 isoform X7 [Sceloporus undulatus]|nr:cytoplasmic polyadenylation element-binding protein 1 isoform X7 [Sceloporus undulatus]XP_042332569.1 cytoplasmic polyadenylation element-binding protein 1 isoform X7 [Sceloporus undulatus]